MTTDNADSGDTRLGSCMINKGLITPADLEAALNRQKELARDGVHKLLGELLAEMGAATPGQVAEGLAVQNRWRH